MDLTKIEALLEHAFLRSIGDKAPLDNQSFAELLKYFGVTKGEDITPDEALWLQNIINEVFGQMRELTISSSDFWFDENAKSSLINIIGKDDPEFINELQNAACFYFEILDSEKNRKQQAEEKAAINRMLNRTKALQECLTDANGNQAYNPLRYALKLRQEPDMLNRLSKELSLLQALIEFVHDEKNTGKRGNPVKWPQRYLAVAVGKLLIDRKIRLTRARSGIFCKCLKIMLQATDTVLIDNDTAGTETAFNIIRAVWPTLESMMPFGEQVQK